MALSTTLTYAFTSGMSKLSSNIFIGKWLDVSQDSQESKQVFMTSARTTCMTCRTTKQFVKLSTREHDNQTSRGPLILVIVKGPFRRSGTNMVSFNASRKIDGQWRNLFPTCSGAMSTVDGTMAAVRTHYR